MFGHPNVIEPLTSEKIYEMSTSELLILAFNFLPKFCSFQVNGTLANLIFTMKKKIYIYIGPIKCHLPVTRKTA